MRKTKRGQMETVGLVVIIILITLGMLFMAKFALKSKPKKNAFAQEELTYTTLSALMETEAKCENQEEIVWLKIGKTLMEDCAERELFGSSTYNCEGKDSCLFLEGLLQELLTQTLGKWGRHYEFKAVLWEGERTTELISLLDEEQKGCPGEKDSSNLFFSFQGMDKINVVLSVCN